MFPEWEGTTDQILPHARLRLVYRQGGSSCQRGTLISRIHPLLIQSMAGLMHRAEQHCQRVVNFIASRDTHIVHAERFLERMGRLVLPAAAPVIAKPGDNLHAEIF